MARSFALSINFVVAAVMMLLLWCREGAAFRMATTPNRLSNRVSTARFLAMEAKKGGRGKKKKDEGGKYSATCILPQTSFDQRANSLKREPEFQKWWEEERIYESIIENNKGPKFTLHDGPPYANGNLHIGHSLNKILKDFINRYQILRGKQVQYVPGWDCHGLPIELKVLQTMKSAEREKLTPITLRKKAAEFAKETVAAQRESFKRYGVWGKWDSPYMTLQPQYEAAQIRVFGNMVKQGHIYRGKKPVHWSPSSRTALAEAELEYPDNHVSRSIYVGFKVVEAAPALVEKAGPIDDLRVAIWTTTPWTMPANLAVAVNAELDYAVVSNSQVANGAKFLVAKELVEALAEKMGLSKDEGQVLEVHTVVKGDALVGTKYQHPLYERQSEIVLGGDYINTESGTGLVHTAPGHGQEDYQTGLKYGLPLLSPVNDLGKFTDEAGERFAGLDVLGSGNQAIIDALQETGTLIKEEEYNHKYPYDWRTKKPTIFRATEQWFASVSTFREQALSAIDTVQWIPAVGKNRITGMTEGRGDWCISRQRSWGVPIPVFYNQKTNEPLMTEETMGHIENIFRERGSDAWWELDVVDLLPESLKDQADQYSKGTDTMDVWFDSGTSWAGVVQERSEELGFPADVYLEGSDQHRGWFQSSLLTAVASEGVAPYKTVLTHGFVLDEKGFKMSKSLGNVVDPLSVIEGGADQKKNPAFGADTLRLWVSGVDYAGDVCVGDNIIKQVSDMYRKLRNTLRFLAGSLTDFDPATQLVPTDQLPSIDKYMLGKLSATVKEVETAYDEFKFYKTNQALVQFSNIDLSSFYLDIAKDRLYISKKDDFRRRAAQTTLYYALEQMALMLAPITPHMAEDLWQNLPYEKPTKSVFQKGWIEEKDRFPEHESELWGKVRLLRNDVNKCIELARTAKEVGATQECRVVLYAADSDAQDMLRRLEPDNVLMPDPVKTNGMDDLRFILQTSQVQFVSSKEELEAVCPTYVLPENEGESGVLVGVTKASGRKCERCWYYSENVGTDHEHTDICPRCADVIRSDNHVVPQTEDAKASV
jgi:isoleucyl-tRNA synthetase